MGAAPQQQKILPVPERQPFFRFVHIYSVHRRRTVQRQDIGTVLIQLQKIAAVLVQYGEVSGDDGLPEGDFAVLGDGLAG